MCLAGKVRRAAVGKLAAGDAIARARRRQVDGPADGGSFQFKFFPVHSRLAHCRKQRGVRARGSLALEPGFCGVLRAVMLPAAPATEWESGLLDGSRERKHKSAQN